jgi:hypothetical protein
MYTTCSGGRLFTPSRFRGFPRYFGASFRSHLIRPRLAALEATLAPKGDGCGVFVGVGGGIWRAVFDLAGEYVAYQLAELDGIAGAGKALF